MTHTPSMQLLRRRRHQVLLTVVGVACNSILLSPCGCEGRPHFRDRIPNGRTVPNPNIPGSVWSGVGHFTVGGSGPRNPFGLDFQDNNYEWTEELCRMDSDGDGRSNGQELGDPNCVWSRDDLDEEGIPLVPEFPAESHPGIVDVVIDIPDTDTCRDYDPPKDTQVLDIQFSQENRLNGTRTQYMCEQFRITGPDYEKHSTTYYHQIKTEVINDNPGVLHHLWIYICDVGESSDGDMVGGGSYICSGIETNCRIVAGWAIGQEELCTPQNVGTPIVFNNATGTQVFKVEAHYNNIEEDPLARDQSGMKFHLTSTIRPVESGLVSLGMDYYDRRFELEPNSETLLARANLCPSKATLRALKHPIWVFHWNPHMHLHGKSLVTEHYRCGIKIGEIGNMPSFEFDNQQSYVIDPPIKVLPGDALITTCYYDTSDTNSTISGGEDPSDEMCDNYLTYFPTQQTISEPTLFTACSSFEMGALEKYVGIDDSIPFVALDQTGEIILNGYQLDLTQDLAPCCDAKSINNNKDASMLAACEAAYLSLTGGPCAIDTDCADELACLQGICGGIPDLATTLANWHSILSIVLMVASTVVVLMV